MPQVQSFYPPQLNPPLVQLMQRVIPPLAAWVYQLDLVISPDSLAQLQAIQSQPCLFLCNHPTFQDPLVMFLLSARLGRPFHYLAAHEQFRGIKGRLYQQIGAYSIRRGLADRDSIAQTLDLMTRPDCQLVIFPEGGCSFQNDTIMPFRPGAIQMALQAIARRAKRGEASAFYVVPMSLKYHYSGDMKQTIEQTLSRLEQTLDLSASGDLYQRLRTVAERVLLRCEQEAGLTSDPTESWNQRIAILKANVLQQCEQQLDLSPAVGEPNRERVYRIRHVLEQRRTTVLDSGIDGWDVMTQAIRRVLNFDAIYDGYVAALPTTERFLDTLVRLEREVFTIDQPSVKGRRRAFIRVAEPINLSDYLAAYQQNRAETVESLMQTTHHTMQQNLDQMAEGLHTLFGKVDTSRAGIL